MNRTLSGVTTPGRVGLGSIAIKGYSAFPKAPILLESHHPGHSLRVRSYPFAEKQSVYSTVPANWVKKVCIQYATSDGKDLILEILVL